MANAKNLTFNIAANYVGVFGQITIAFFLSPFLVNSLGDTGYGVWSIIAAMTGYMAMLDLGISSAVMRFVAQFHSRKDYASLNRVFNTALALFCGISVFLLLMSPLLSRVLGGVFADDPAMESLIQVLIITTAFDMSLFIIGGLFKSTFKGFQRFAVTNIAILASGVYKASLFYFVISSGHGLLAMSLISISANLIMLLGLLWYARRSYPFLSIGMAHIDKGMVRKIAGFSKFSFLAILAEQLIYYSDAFVIGYFMSAAAVTYYTIPWSLTEYTNRLITAITRTYTPHFSSMEEQHSSSELFDSYVIGTKITLFLSNVVCIGVLVLGDAFLEVWMGPKYAVICTPILLVLFTCQMIKSPQLISYSVLQGTGKHKNFAYIKILVSAANLLLSIAMIQKYGLMGVAGATAFTQVLFYGVVVPNLTFSALGVSAWEYYRRTYLGTVLPSLTALVVAWSLKQYHYPDTFANLLGYGLLTFIAYTLVSYVTALTPSERIYIRGRCGHYLPKTS